MLIQINSNSTFTTFNEEIIEQNVDNDNTQSFLHLVNYCLAYS